MCSLWAPFTILLWPIQGHEREVLPAAVGWPGSPGWRPPLAPVFRGSLLTPLSRSRLLQEFQEHMSGAQHQQRLGAIQHMSQAFLLSLLPVPRDVLEREDE